MLASGCILIPNCIKLDNRGFVARLNKYAMIYHLILTYLQICIILVLLSIDDPTALTG